MLETLTSSIISMIKYDIPTIILTIDEFKIFRQRSAKTLVMANNVYSPLAVQGMLLATQLKVRTFLVALYYNIYHTMNLSMLIPYRIFVCY